MQWTHCPSCTNLLETCETTPCYICGGWPERVRHFDSTQPFTEYELPNGTRLILCSGCLVEEFMVEGGYGWRLNLPRNRLPVNYLTQIREIAQPELALDKYCEHCHKRLAFLKVLATVKNDSAVTP